MSVIKKDMELLRAYMCDEVEQDISSGHLCTSEIMNGNGARVYPSLLKEAVRSGNFLTLKSALKRDRCFKVVMPAETSRGVGLQRVDEQLEKGFAEKEFDRLYLRAVCRHAIDNGRKSIRVVAKSPLLDDNMQACRIDPLLALKELRDGKDIDEILNELDCAQLEITLE